MKFFFTFALLGLFLVPKVSLAQSFSDVPQNHKFYEEIEFVKSEGFVKGYSDNTYQPEAKINRAEFTKIIIESLYTDQEINSCDILKYYFPDIHEYHWSEKYICVAKKEGIINGYSDGVFKASNTITLPEAMKIILEANNIHVPVFSGGANVEHWGVPYLSYFLEEIQEKEQNLEKIILTDEVNKTWERYEHAITRGEMAYLIWKIKKEQAPTNIGNNKYENFLRLENGELYCEFGDKNNLYPDAGTMYSKVKVTTVEDPSSFIVLNYGEARDKYNTYSLFSICTESIPGTCDCSITKK